MRGDIKSQRMDLVKWGTVKSRKERGPGLQRGTCLSSSTPYPWFHCPRFQVPVVNCGPEADDPPSIESSGGQ